MAPQLAIDGQALRAPGIRCHACWRYSSPMVLRRRKLPVGVIDVFKDRFGRVVTLTEDRWRHILTGHPEMDGCEHAIKRAVENADVCKTGHTPGTELVFGQNLGPAKWLAVVVAFKDGEAQGTIITAYPQTKDPGGGER